MRKSIFTIVLAVTAFFASAQTVDDAVKHLDKKNFDKAKEVIDKLTADPNSKNADAWFVKAEVYNALALDEKFRNSVPNAYEQAFEAYKKAYDIDPNNKRILLDAYRAVFISYEGIANKAAKAYQAKTLDDLLKANTINQEEFNKRKNDSLNLAFEIYKKTVDNGAWLNSKNLTYGGYSVPKVDTGMIFMSGYTAMKLDKKDDAINYFARLANARIGVEPDYVIPYQYLAFQYKDRKDEANFKKYTDLGKQIYPKDPYFVTINLDWSRDNKNFTELFNSYEQLIALQPDSMNNYLSYASEMFDYLFKGESEKKAADFDAIAVKIENALNKTLSKNYETLSSSLLLAQLYYNQGVDFSTEADKIRSTKPEDIKKKNDFKAKAAAKYEPGIPHAEKVASLLETKGVANLKLSEKATLKNMYIMLGEMYSAKGNKAKADEFDKKYASIK